jgi:hypothetical protein
MTVPEKKHRKASKKLLLVPLGAVLLAVSYGFVRFVGQFYPDKKEK